VEVMTSPDEQALRAQVDQARDTLRRLADELDGVDAEFDALAPQRTQHELLDQACGSLEKLAELGVASLFWGDRNEPAATAGHLRQVRARVAAFQAQLGQLDERRQAIRSRMAGQEEALEILGEDLYQVREQEERRKLEWIVEREIDPLPARVQVMAWARGGEDDRRLRKALAAALAASLLTGALLPLIDLPIPKRFEAADVPKRLAQLVRQEQARPVPPPVVDEPRPVETPPDEAEPEPVREQVPDERPKQAPKDQPAFAAAEPAPKKKVEKAGLLAFRDKFASLAKDDVAPRLGTDARFNDADDASAEPTTRAMLTSNAPGSSGGINLASLSRNAGGGGNGGGGGGGGAGGLRGVQVGQVASSIGGGGGAGGDRPLASGGPGLTRTDEEIQIVFDRYKAALYRLYNRELRKDPTLRGQMILRLTIEPDGSVSMCALQASDMNAPELSVQVVDRVRTINFGAKDGVEAMTIVYPIDFLPAA